MKKYLITKILLFYSLFATSVLIYAQVTETENYVQSIIYLDSTKVSDASKKRIETVQYFDGLGRLKQTVNVKASPLGRDLVTPFVYDNIGRQGREYFPIPQNGTTTGAIYQQNSGTVPYPVADPGNLYGGEKIFSEKQFENSPLNRIRQITQAGTAWSTKPVQYGQGANKQEDNVKKYETVTTWDATNKIYTSAISQSSFYSQGQLYKNTTADEDGNQTKEFTNSQRQTVLVRKVLSPTENADTYYVYNEYNQLAYVIPPTAAVTTLDGTVLDNLCYQYKYDSRYRLAEKKLPGKGWELMVYDKQDRLILTQDAVLGTTANNFGSKGWLFTKYDQFDRIVYTGFFSNTASRIAMQTAVNNMTVNAGNNEIRSDDTPFRPQDLDVYYTKNAFPTESMTVLAINYYDTYPPGMVTEIPVSILGQKVLQQPGNGTIKNTNGLALSSYLKNIEDVGWTRNYSWYDTKGRVIGTYSMNYLAGFTDIKTEYDFGGAVKQTVTKHKRLRTDTEKLITETFTYDHQNRMLIHRHKIDNNTEEILTQNKYNELSQLESKKMGGASLASPLQTIDYRYNIRGWMTRINDPVNLNGKLFGYEIKYDNPAFTNLASGRFNGNIAEVDWKNASEGALKRYSYVYDGLNRLKDAVYTEPNSTNPYNNNFNEHLTYDLNGNIMTLKRNAFPIFGSTSTQVDDLVYNYTGNRLNQVLENSLNDTGYEGGNNIIDYDLNGNMTTMKDKGIQQIVYNYLNLPNNFSITQTDPLFGQSKSATLDYLYRADGTKLRKNYFRQGGRGYPGTTLIVEYLDGFQYNYKEGGGLCLTCRTETAFEEQAYANVSKVLPGLGDPPAWRLDFVPTSEGFYSFTENRYIYQYKDHLGNSRISFAKNSEGALEVTDTNNYYPFGLNHIGGNNNGQLGGYLSYKYNGKELQETGMYDYGARMYMPDIGRWGVMDNKAEKYFPFSGYNYAINNPIKYLDPDGNDVVPWFVNSFKSDGSMRMTKNYATKEFNKAMTDFAKTDYGKNFLLSFMKQGQSIYGLTAKESGKNSDSNLNLINLNLEYATGNEKANTFMSSDGTTWEGEIVLPSDENKLDANVYFDTNGVDQYSLGETITHEIALHGSHYNKSVENAKKGGEKFDPAKNDHEALKEKDTKNKAYKNYETTMKQLIKQDEKYKKDAKINE